MSQPASHDVESRSFAGADLLENISEGLYSLDADWNLTFFNSVAERFFACERRDVLGRRVWDAFPGLAATTLGEGLREAMTWREPRQVTGVCPRTGRMIEARAFPVKDGGLGVAWQEPPADRVERGALEEALRTQELLYLELTHRVTNHFQMVAARLALQAREMPDEPTRDAFLQIASSVRCMALVNRRLNRGDKGLGDQDLGEYLLGLAEDLGEGLLPDNIRLCTDVDDGVTVSADVASLVGMIVAELVVNARKHAWPEGEEGWIHVRVRELDQLIEVEVQNDGRSFPAREKSDGAGLRLLERQVASLKGEFSPLDVSDGAAFRLRFPAH